MPDLNANWSFKPKHNFPSSRIRRIWKEAVIGKRGTWSHFGNIVIYLLLKAVILLNPDNSIPKIASKESCSTACSVKLAHPLPDSQIMALCHQSKAFSSKNNLCWSMDLENEKAQHIVSQSITLISLLNIQGATEAL